MTDATPTSASTATTATTLADRRLIRVAGEDVRGFLQGLVTQDVVGLTPDTPRWAALLTPQGKALFDFILWAEGEAVLIDAEASQAEVLARRLAMYRLRRAITIEPVEDWPFTGARMPRDAPGIRDWPSLAIAGWPRRVTRPAGGPRTACRWA